MFTTDRLARALGAELCGVDFGRPIGPDLHDAIYRALIENLVIFFRGTEISPRSHLDFARAFGTLDQPHPVYPNVDGHEEIVLLENDASRPPDTNCWHTDLTFRAEQPFASILVARKVPGSRR